LGGFIIPLFLDFRSKFHMGAVRVIFIYTFLSGIGIALTLHLKKHL